MPLDWRHLLPPAPEPPAIVPSPTTEPLVAEGSARTTVVPSVEPARPLDNTDPAYHSRRATPAEIARAEAFRDACERELDAAEQRSTK